MDAAGTARLARLRDLRAVNAAIARVSPFTYPNERSTQDHLRELRRRRNPLLPINRLPTELLSEIFLYVRRGRRNHQWLPVTQVCFLWRTICLGLGPLWSDISDDCCLQWVTCCMERSGQAPLAIDIYCEDDEDDDAMIELALSAMHRCRKLVAAGSAARSVDHFQRFTSPAPRLEELDLCYDDDSDIDPIAQLPPQLFACQTPCLKSFHTSSCSLDLGSPFFNSLTNLEDIVFHCMALPKRPSSADFLGLLQRSPRLRQLHLTEFLPCAMSTNISLAALGQLHIREVRLSTCLHFLRNVSFPRANDIAFRLDYINLDKHKNHERSISLVSSLLGYVKSAASSDAILAASAGFTNQAFSVRYEIVASEDELAYQVDVWHPHDRWPSRVLTVFCEIRSVSNNDPASLWKTMVACTSTWFEPPLLARRIQKLKMGDWGKVGDALSYSLQFWLPILDVMSNVRYLHLFGDAGVLFLRMLSISSLDDPFPELEQLVLERLDLREKELKKYLFVFLERRQHIMDLIHLADCQGVFRGALATLSHFSRDKVVVTHSRLR